MTYTLHDIHLRNVLDAPAGGTGNKPIIGILSLILLMYSSDACNAT